MDNPLSSTSSTATVPEPSIIAPRPLSFVSSSSSRHFSRSSRNSTKLSSSSSSRIRAKHLEATAKLKIAQLKLVHVEERANEEAQLLRLKKEIEQREAVCEIALARAEYEIYNKFAAKTTRLSDDVTTILSSDNENTVETVVRKTCSKQIVARSSSLLFNNLSASNTLSLGGLPPAQFTMSTGPVLGFPLVQSSRCTGPVLGFLPIQSSFSTCQVWSFSYVHGPLPTHPDFFARSSHMQVAPSVAHSYSFNRLPASNPLGLPPSSADSPIYSHVSPLIYPAVYNQNSVNYDSLFLPHPEFPKFSGGSLEY